MSYREISNHREFVSDAKLYSPGARRKRHSSASRKAATHRLFNYMKQLRFLVSTWLCAKVTLRHIEMQRHMVQPLQRKSGCYDGC